MIDLIVPVYNQPALTKEFIASVNKNKNINLIFIDNNSDSETKKVLQQSNAYIIVNKENKGYVEAINQGLKVATSEHICFGNNDILLPKDMFVTLEEKLDETDIVAPLSNNISATKHELLIDFEYSSYAQLNSFFNELKKKNKGILTPVDFVYGHCMLLKRSVVEKIGGLDENFGMGNYDDIDFCKRAKQDGFQISLANDCFVYHHCHATFNKTNIDVNSLIKKNKDYFEKKWQE